MSFTKPTKHSKSSRVWFEPHGYQKESIEFGISRPAAGFFLAPGLGKTMIILMIFRILKKLGLVDHLLVLAKRRIVYNVWPKEMAKWKQTRKFTYSIVHGSKKGAQLWDSTDVKLMNYEGLPWLAEPDQQKWFKGRRVMLAVDESSKVKHTRTLRFKSLKKLLPKFARRYIMTGSPTPNSMLDIFGQMYVLDLGETLGRFITHFKNQYFYPSGFMGYDWKLMKGGEKRIFKKLRPYIIRFGTDMLNLPPLTFVDRYVQLPDKTRVLYNKLEKEFILQFQEGDINAANAAVVSGKLRQVANGGVFYTKVHDKFDVANPYTMKREPKKWREVHTEKIEELVELLDELNGEPAFVAYEFKHDVERIKRYFKKNAPQYKNAPFIGGGAKDKEVDKVLRLWDKGKIPVLFGHPDSVAHGLNLQGKGGIVIFFALTWNLENYEQFIQRVWRQGQKRRVIVYRIIAENTVDEVMVHSLRSKDRNQRRLLKAMENKYGIRQKDGRDKGRKEGRARQRVYAVD